MKLSVFKLLSIWFFVGVHSADAADSKTLFDLDEIRDQASLEIVVLQDWKVSTKEPAMRQKLIEITVCEWWEGQKVRLPVTFVAPVDGEPCKNIIVANQPPIKRPGTPTADQLSLLKDHGVGVVLIGMGTIDAMEPDGTLHRGMREQLLNTKDPRFSPAWIWGMSQMRALTAALTEPEVFQPEKVLSTGGSKRGVAAAVAGIHDDRFTAIIPVVAPPLGNPGASDYVIGTEPELLRNIDEIFYLNLAAGKLPLKPEVAKALQDRAKRRADNRFTLEQTRAAGWTDSDIKTITDRIWDFCHVAPEFSALKKRGLDIFYNVGTNDSVTPDLLKLGKQRPDFPICIIPGGQHGGPATAGYTSRVPLLPEVLENFISFARHHFFGDRKMISPPKLVSKFDRETKTLSVTATFSDGIEPEKNELWWNLNRSLPYTLPFEYDHWDSIPMKKTGAGQFTVTVKIEEVPKQLDFLTLHTHTENELPLTISSPYRRINFDEITVALIGDSTVTDASGWGKAFANRFGENVTTHNFSVGGRSAKSWIEEGRLKATIESEPDFILIQFGHNGQPGKGPKRETDPGTTYREYLKRYIDAAHEMGATPVLLSSVTRRDFTEDGKIRVRYEAIGGATRPLKPWADAAKSVAAEMDVPFIDLYELSVDFHNKIGREASAKMNPKQSDITHFESKGAAMIADLIVNELKVVAPNLASFLK